MALYKRTNKTALPVIMTATGDQALASGTFATATTALGVANGQIGLLSWDLYSTTRALGTFLVAGDTATQVRQIKIVRGTPKSSATQTASTWEDGDQSHIESEIIKAENIHSVAVKRARYAKNGAVAFSAFATPQDDTEYSMNVRLLSVRNDKYYGDNDETFKVTVPATDFTGLGTVSAKDYVLQYMVDGVNRRSRYVGQNAAFHTGNKNVVAFGIKAGGGSGQALGTIAVGTSIPFITINGITTSYVADIPFIRAIAELVQNNAALTNTSTIETVNLTTAGSAATIDTFVVLGLQENTNAYFDNIEQVQTRVDASLGAGFLTDATLPTETPCFPDEGTGQGSKWAIVSSDRYLLRVHTMQKTPMGEFFAEGKDYIDPTKLYTSYIIDYYDTEDTLTTKIKSPKTLVLLFPAEKSSAFTINVANVVTNIAASNPPITIITSNDAGTGTASAVTKAAIVAALDVWLESARVKYGFDVIGDATAGGPYLV